MSFARKTNTDTADRPLNTLPEMPLLAGLSEKDRGLLTEWWMNVRDVLDREDEVLRKLKSSSTSGSTATQEVSNIVQIGGGRSGGVSREEVEQIVGESINDAISNARYTHNQGSPAFEWFIVHDLGWKPSATVIDSMGNQVFGDVTHDSVTQLRIRFYSSFSGVAYLT
jgi:hypothetical protein